MDELDEFLFSLPCCSCMKPIREGGSHINNICLQRLAKWEYPTWSNFFYFEFKGAVAIICDDCLGIDEDPYMTPKKMRRGFKFKNPPKFAVQIDTQNKTAFYYRISKLKTIPLCYKCIYFDRQGHRNTKLYRCLAKGKVLMHVPKQRCQYFKDAAKAAEQSLLILTKGEERI